MNPNKFTRTKYACYSSSLAMSSVFSLPPILFVTFREMYGISYTLLGTLVLINFCTQLTIDLIFTFFTKYFNIRKTVRTMPVLTAVGLFIYALVPTCFPQYAYVGFVVGTIIFSVSAGLNEVLLSPIVAAIPSETPDRDMSRLHSLYAYGVMSVVTLSTVMLHFLGRENWMYVALFWGLVQFIPCIMFSISPIPDMNDSHIASPGKTNAVKGFIPLCVFCIFFGSAAENTMTNWVSGFMERALNIPKVAGDIFGLALFAVVLGLARSAYAKYGRNISSVLAWSMAGSAVCYLTVAFCSNIYISAFFCVATGFCTAMLWPGTLIMMEEKIPSAGVAAYALMAAGGDLGGSVAPQLMGAVVDKVTASQFATKIGSSLSITAEQVGMKAGMLISAVFPIIGFLLLLYIRKNFYKKNMQK